MSRLISRCIVGAALLFSVTASGQIEKKLTAADAAADDNFGYSVSVNGDTAIVGAYFDDDVGSDGGAAYKFLAPPFNLGELYCFADGSGTPCPCGNESTLVAGEGCVIGGGLEGSRLVAWGTTSVAEDDLQLGAAPQSESGLDRRRLFSSPYNPRAIRSPCWKCRCR